MLLTNGRFYTMDTAGTVVDTLVVRDGRVAFAGRRGDVNVPDAEETRDLGGRAVLPGLVDGHAHLNGLARGSMQLRANGVRSEEEIARMVGEAAAHGPTSLLLSTMTNLRQDAELEGEIVAILTMHRNR